MSSAPLRLYRHVPRQSSILPDTIRTFSTTPPRRPEVASVSSAGAGGVVGEGIGNANEIWIGKRYGAGLAHSCRWLLLDGARKLGFPDPSGPEVHRSSIQPPPCQTLLQSWVKRRSSKHIIALTAPTSCGSRMSGLFPNCSGIRRG